MFEEQRYVVPAWKQILARDAPPTVLLPFGAPGLWLLRMTAEDMDGLEVRIVAGDACTDSARLFDEWAGALEFPDHFGRSWDAFGDCLGDLEWLDARAAAVLVSSAEAVLGDEPNRVATLVETIRAGAEKLAGDGRALRVLFQSSRSEHPRLALLRELGVETASVTGDA